MFCASGLGSDCQISQKKKTNCEEEVVPDHLPSWLTLSLTLTPVVSEKQGMEKRRTGFLSLTQKDTGGRGRKDVMFMGDSV